MLFGDDCTDMRSKLHGKRKKIISFTIERQRMCTFLIEVVDHDYLDKELDGFLTARVRY